MAESVNLDDLIDYYVKNEIPFSSRIFSYSLETQSNINKVFDCYMTEGKKEGSIRVVLEHK